MLIGVTCLIFFFFFKWMIYFQRIHDPNGRLKKVLLMQRSETISDSYDFLWLLQWTILFYVPPFSFHFSPSLSLHLLKSLSQRGAHQISIVDLLMLRSVLHRQRFHTQDEREVNTEDARGDTGPWPLQPLPLWPLDCTGLGSERSWGGGAKIEVCHLYNND